MTNAKRIFLAMGVIAILALTGCGSDKLPEESTEDKAKGAVSGVLEGISGAADTLGAKGAGSVKKVLGKFEADRLARVAKWQAETGIAQVLPIATAGTPIPYWFVSDGQMGLRVALDGTGWTFWVMAPPTENDIRFTNVDRPVKAEFKYENGRVIPFTDGPGITVDLRPEEAKLQGLKRRRAVRFFVDDTSRGAELVVFFKEIPR